MPEITEWHAMTLARAFGYLTLREVFAMYTLAAMLPDRARVVNIGVGTGTSSLCFREAGSNLEIFSIDISEGGPLGGMQNERNVYAQCGRSHELTKQVLGDSKQIGLAWELGGVDCVFVDADHSKAGISGDIEVWWPHLKLGGYMAFHDYTRDVWPDVAPVVEMHIRATNARRIFKVDTLIVIQKMK